MAANKQERRSENLTVFIISDRNTGGRLGSHQMTDAESMISMVRRDK